MAVMLNMTDEADGFPYTRLNLFHFTLCNQAVAITAFEGLLWHISCAAQFVIRDMAPDPSNIKVMGH
jgi:hypothetical protein